MKLSHKFVKNIPDYIENGVLYISVDYSTVVHKCCCGCGNEVITPLGPTDWTLSFNGESISLDPSIGNWSFPCKSHYWIKNSGVVWARRWSQKEIEKVRTFEHYEKESHFSKIAQSDNDINIKGIWFKFTKWWR